MSNADVKSNSVIDISIKSAGRKPVRINGDDNKIVMLNLTDMNISLRLSESLPKLKELEQKVTEILSSLGDVQQDVNSSDSNEHGKMLKQCDDEMKRLIDYIFDANISDVCCEGGSMYDVVEGVIRYEEILEQFGALYGRAFEDETKRIERRIKKHTAKYGK